MNTVPTELRSDRLLLRRWTTSDRRFFADMNADPVVMKYSPSTLTRSESDAFVERIEEHFETEGFGLWAVEIEDTAGGHEPTLATCDGEGRHATRFRRRLRPSSGC